MAEGLMVVEYDRCSCYIWKILGVGMKYSTVYFSVVALFKTAARLKNNQQRSFIIGNSSENGAVYENSKLPLILN
jgi:hypothetical protein